MSNIMPISDLRNYNEVMKATLKLLTNLEEGEKSSREEGWLSAVDVETALGI